MKNRKTHIMVKLQNVREKEKNLKTLREIKEKE